jgi:hypothetical protein
MKLNYFCKLLILSVIILFAGKCWRGTQTYLACNKILWRFVTTAYFDIISALYRYAISKELRL